MKDLEKIKVCSRNPTNKEVVPVTHILVTWVMKKQPYYAGIKTRPPHQSK